ncbi:MAG: VRR-NUC domain-containing protein [Gaiellaceae bacterium]
MSETDLQASVVDLAQRLGYLTFHDYDSRKNTRGFPDLVMAHPRSGALIMAELKSAGGKVTPEQDQWLRALGLRAAVFVWRPAHWHDGSIHAALSRYARTIG